MTFHTLCYVGLLLVLVQRILVHAQNNVALASAGGICDSHPPYNSDLEQSKPCTGAIDGVSLTSSNAYRWSFVGDPVNSWFLIVFAQRHYISRARFMPLPGDERTIKDALVEFDDQDVITGTFNAIAAVGHSFSATTGDYVWEDVPISPAVWARRARLLVLTSYRTVDLYKAYNGLTEVEFYGSLTTTTTTTQQTTTTTPTTTTTTPTTTTTTTLSPPATTTTTLSNPAATTTTTTSPSTTASTTTTITPSTSSTTTTTTISPTAGASAGEDEGPDMLPIIIGAAAGGFVLILIVIAVICLRHRRKRSELPKEEEPEPLTEVNAVGKEGAENAGFQPDVVPVPEPAQPLESPPPRPVSAVSDVNDNVEDIYHNPPLLESEPIQIEDLPQYIMQAQEGPKGFSPEFARLPKGQVFTTVYGSRDSVKVKNRFRNIIPYDQTRVKLKEKKGKKHSTYYNGNYIEGYKTKWQYIAAQGPLQGTVDDFWRLVWEQDSAKVVMVTNLKESGRDKCYKYWPEQSEKYGELKVTNLLDQMHVLPDYTIKVFRIEKGVVTKVVGHFHYTTWPDEGVPDAATSLLSFHNLIMTSSLGTGKGPMLIHCSAGVGRTGTLIAVDRMCQQAKEEGFVDVLKCVASLRTDRMSMVQSVDQYEFIYLALVEKLLCSDIRIPCSRISQRLPSLLANIPGKDLNMIEQQYNILEVFRIRVPNSLYEVGRSAENKSKNRDDAVLPGEYNRPYLAPLSDNKNSYINAVFVRGYRRRDAFIVTQMPLEHTQVDLWRTVRDFRCRTIVMLNSLESTEQVNCGAYWPEDADELTKEIGRFTITKLMSSVDSHVQTTLLKVNFKDKEKESFKVTHYRLLDWVEGSAFPENKTSLLSLYNKIQAAKEPKDESPILVHCMFGDDRSGLFCSMSVMCETADVEREIDVFNPVRRSRRGRSQFTPTVEQYRYLYELADEYIQSPAILGNDVTESDDDVRSEAGTVDGTERHVIKIEMD